MPIIWLKGVRVPVPAFFEQKIARVQAEVDKRRHALALGTIKERATWFASFDSMGRYLHWSGFWESTSGRVLDEKTGSWYCAQ